MTIACNFLGQCQQQWWNMGVFRNSKFSWFMRDLVCYENENELFSASQVHKAQFQVPALQIFLWLNLGMLEV